MLNVGAEGERCRVKPRACARFHSGRRLDLGVLDCWGTRLAQAGIVDGGRAGHRAGMFESIAHQIEPVHDNFAGDAVTCELG